MKKLFLLLFGLLAILCSSSSWAYVHVRGYYRSNGTYVNPHIRTHPDGNPYNNLSSFNFESSPIKGTPFNPEVETAVSKIV